MPYFVVSSDQGSQRVCLHSSLPFVLVLSYACCYWCFLLAVLRHLHVHARHSRTKRRRHVWLAHLCVSVHAGLDRA